MGAANDPGPQADPLPPGDRVDPDEPGHHGGVEVVPPLRPDVHVPAKYLEVHKEAEVDGFFYKKRTALERLAINHHNEQNFRCSRKKNSIFSQGILSFKE